MLTQHNAAKYLQFLGREVDSVKPSSMSCLVNLRSLENGALVYFTRSTADCDRLRIIGNVFVGPDLLFTENTAVVDNMGWRRTGTAQCKESNDVVVELRDWEGVLNGRHTIDDVGLIPIIVHALYEEEQSFRVTKNGVDDAHTPSGTHNMFSFLAASNSLCREALLMVVFE